MDASRTRRAGIVGDLEHWWQGRREEWHAGERHLAYTILACSAILLLGLIVVPLSIPEPLPGPDRSQVLGERFLRALPVNTKDRPTLAEVEKSYGSNGGDACTAKLADAYGLLVTKVGKGPRTAFNRAAHARMKLVHQVYCPERTEEFATYVKQRTRANALARQRALEAQQAAAYGY